jgi:hypothetical protein
MDEHHNERAMANKKKKKARATAPDTIPDAQPLEKHIARYRRIARIKRGPVCQRPGRASSGDPGSSAAGDVQHAERLRRR